LAVRPEDVAEHGGVDEVGILRMDADAANELRALQSDMAPASAGIGGLVEAVAIGDVEPDRRLTGAGIDDVRIRWRHGDRADSGAAHVAVGHAAPEHAAILGLPDAAGTGADIERHPVDGIARNRADAASARGTNAAPFQGIEARLHGRAWFG